MTQPDGSYSCPRPDKRGYATRADAKADLKRMGGAKFIRCYECRCGRWHLGHAKYAPRRRKKKGEGTDAKG